MRGSGSVADTAEPAVFAGEWARERAGRAAEGASGGGGRTAPVDPEARARRQAERLALMTAGMADLSLWLTDVVRTGTVQARRQPWGWWDAAAARLVDAARHVGHADIMREGIDGAVGFDASSPPLHGHDPAFWRARHAEIERAARAAGAP